MLDGMRRQRAAYVFDKASQASSISSGGLWGCRGGNEQIARGWIIASRERLIFFCRVEEQSAPETRASAFPRRGGDAIVPSYEARRRRSPSGRVSPHRDERDNLAAPKSSGAAVTSCERRGGGQPTDSKAGGRWRRLVRTAKSPTSLCRLAP